jgi:hypothetical protein
VQHVLVIVHGQCAAETNLLSRILGQKGKFVYRLTVFDVRGGTICAFESDFIYVIQGNFNVL